MLRRRQRDLPAPQWSQQKMQALLAGGAVTGLLLITGLGYTAYTALTGRRAVPVARSIPAEGHPVSAVAAGHATPATAPVAPDQAGAALQAREDALAESAMPTADDDAAHPGPVSTRDPGAPMVLPRASSTGAAGVPSGFPQTPEGAVAQLAAIDVTAVQSASLPVARQVITGWAAPGGPTPTSWSTVAAMAQLFTSAQVAGSGSPQLALVLTPEMGEIKGTVGDSFVVACVDFELDVTVTQTARGAVADCQRMTWSDSRWVIGAGSEAAQPPAVWADTDTAITVGYRDITHG